MLRACFWLGKREYRGLVLAFRLAAPTLTLSRAQGPPRRGGADRALIARPVSPAVGVSAIWYANRLLTTPIGTRLTPQMSSVTRADGREPGRRERKERALPCVEDRRARLMARHKLQPCAPMRLGSCFSSGARRSSVPGLWLAISTSRTRRCRVLAFGLRADYRHYGRRNTGETR